RKFQIFQNFEMENQKTLDNEAVRNIQMKEEYVRINKILNILPKEQADVVRFRIVDELSFKEITAILGKPESTIKSRFQYALKKLKNHDL
ncbi:MAG: ECF-type sigma factor, partial [Bacteroidetes bacterium]|nr:ECF-type sigma factor [Bacteroidota bacterium]